MISDFLLDFSLPKNQQVGVTILPLCAPVSSAFCRVAGNVAAESTAGGNLSSRTQSVPYSHLLRGDLSLNVIKAACIRTQDLPEHRCVPLCRSLNYLEIITHSHTHVLFFLFFLNKQAVGNRVMLTFRGNVSCSNEGISCPPVLCSKTWSSLVWTRSIRGRPWIWSYLCPVISSRHPPPQIGTRIARWDQLVQSHKVKINVARLVHERAGSISPSAPARHCTGASIRAR